MSTGNLWASRLTITREVPTHIYVHTSNPAPLPMHQEAPQGINIGTILGSCRSISHTVQLKHDADPTCTMRLCDGVLCDGVCVGQGLHVYTTRVTPLPLLHTCTADLRRSKHPAPSTPRSTVSPPPPPVPTHISPHLRHQPSQSINLLSSK